MARRRPPTVHGLAVVDKPAGITSHDAVGVLRRRLGERRVGHAGTLDPDATGVLLVGVGSATRLLQFLTAQPKRYVGEVVLGSTTSTLDAAGEVTGRFDMLGVTVDMARAAARGLTGAIRQVPPMVSAIRVGGRRLHELAREGIEVEREARPVTVHRFDVESTDDPMVLRIDVECSSGTYIRSLAADLGAALGGGAHLRGLRRTAIGEFTIDEAVPLEEVNALLPVVAAMRSRPLVTVDADVASLVANGRQLGRALGFEGDGPWGIVDGAGELLAVYGPTSTADLVTPVVVLNATSSAWTGRSGRGRSESSE